MNILNRPAELFLQGLQCIENAIYIGCVSTSGTECLKAYVYFSSYMVALTCIWLVYCITDVGEFCCQFVKGQKWPELTLHLVQSFSLGQKDAHRTLFSVWQHIFAMPKAKRYEHALCELQVCSVCVIVQERHFNAVFCTVKHCWWQDLFAVVTGRDMWILMIGRTVYNRQKNWSEWTRTTTCHWHRG